MAGHECYHCKQWVDAGDSHDCWTTTEAALTRDLPDDLREAWERLRETAADFGEQRIYASHHSIMFSRKSCYVFVRPKAKYLELCIFLPRVETSPRIRTVYESSTIKRAHMLRVVHRDEVEAPLTDWMREAYDFAAPDAPPPARLPKTASKPGKKSAVKATSARKPASMKKPRAAKKRARKVASPRKTRAPRKR